MIMRMNTILKSVAAAAILSVVALPVQAATVVANTVIEFFDSGAGPLLGPYGSSGGSSPVAVSTSVATDGLSNTFVSLPTGSFLTLGFAGAQIFDGTGDDIFISELGNGAEDANVFVSADFGLTFTFLGVAFGNSTTGLDLNDIPAFSGFINAVKVVGLDNGGSSPGFDLAFVQGLEGSVNLVPVPAALPLLITGLIGLGIVGRRKKPAA